MAQSFETILNTLQTDYFMADKEWGDSGTDWTKANNYHTAANYISAQYYILACLTDIRQAIQRLLSDHAVGHSFSPYSVPLLFHLFLDPEYTPIETDGDVTWQAICEAWAANDFEGRAMTIAFIDRQRQLIWNESFDVQWAAKPE